MRSFRVLIEISLFVETAESLRRKYPCKFRETHKFRCQQIYLQWVDLLVFKLAFSNVYCSICKYMCVYVHVCEDPHTHTFSPYFWDRASHRSWSSLIVRLTGQQALGSLSFCLFLTFSLSSRLTDADIAFKNIFIMINKSIHLFDIPTAVSPFSYPPLPSPYLTPHNTIPHPTPRYPNPLLCFCPERARSPSTCRTASRRSRTSP